MSRYRDPSPSLFKRGSYYVFWYWDGERRRLKSTGCTTIRRAREKQTAFLRKLSSSGFLDSFLSGWFVRETCPWTRRHVEAGGSASDDYLENRRGYVTNHIIPRFGNYQVSGITSSEIRSWLYNLPLSLQTKKHIYTTLRDIFQFAYDNGDISENPMDRVNSPIVSSSSSREAYTREEAWKTIQAAQGLSGRAFLALMTMYLSGVRSGELRALRGSDVISDPIFALWVRNAMKRHGVVGDPKTRSSWRVVPIPVLLYSNLYMYKKVYGVDDDDRLFPVSKETISRWAREATKRAEIERPGLSAHSFRHSYVSALRGSVNDDVLGAASGHAGKESVARYDARWLRERLEFVAPIVPLVEKSFFVAQESLQI